MEDNVRYDPFDRNLGVSQEKVDKLRLGLIGQKLKTFYAKDSDADPFELGKYVEDIYRFTGGYEPDDDRSSNDSVQRGRDIYLGRHVCDTLGLDKNDTEICGAVAWTVNNLTMSQYDELPLASLLSCANVPGAKSVPYEAYIVCKEGDEVNSFAVGVCDEYGIDMTQWFKNAIGDGEKKIIHTDGYELWVRLPMEVVHTFIEKDAEEMIELEKQGVSRQDVVDRMVFILNNVVTSSYRFKDEIAKWPYEMATFARDQDLNCPFPNCGKVKNVGDADIGDARTKYGDQYPDKLRLNSLSIHLIEKHGLFQKGESCDNTQRYPNSAKKFYEKHMKGCC
jgi:hypothetical protein